MRALVTVQGLALPLKRLGRVVRGFAALATVSLTACHAAAVAAAGPTVTEVVEFTRIVFPEAGDIERLQSQVSPDGRSAFVVTRRANTRTDRNRYEILLFDLRPEQLAAGKAGAPVVVAALEPVLDDNVVYMAVQNVQWLDSGTIVFRARLADKVFQVFKVDTARKRLTQLTFSPTDVVSFALSDGARRVVYAAQENNPPMAPGQRALVVGNKALWTVHLGQQYMHMQQRRYQVYVSEGGSRRPARKLGGAFAEASTRLPAVSISPDGRWVLLPRYDVKRQLSWSRQYPLVEEASRFGPGVNIDPRAYFTRSTNYVPRQMLAHRLSDGTERPIVDAPDDSKQGQRSDLLWQGDGRSVIVGGTHLPMDDGVAGRSNGSHVIEYWPDSGRWNVVAELQGRLNALRPLPGGGGFAVTDAGGRRTFQRQADGTWLGSPRTGAPAADPRVVLAAAGWTLRLKDSLDVPPDVFLEGPAGQELQLTRLNPGVSSAWGTMRPYAWKDAKGRDWKGGLMVPADHDAGVRHPLVIQTYGFSPDRFYLDGANTVIGVTSGFAGRAFLREKILVLALPVRASTNAPTTEAGAMIAFMDGVRGAIDALVAGGLVDKDRIGIMGFSMTGQQVLNQVTFSDAPIRAATILDGDANTLFSVTVTYGASDGIAAAKAAVNEGLPYGSTLATWIRNDPALHTDCVRAALRIETYGPEVRNNWDIYALLRRQYKPAEMVFFPTGTHGLMNPTERMISLQGNVDWFRFWLKGEERSEPVLVGESDETLKEQYRRWREMAELKRAVDAQPACPPRGG